MNTIFYRALLYYDHYTPNEKMVYSFLLYKSIPLIDCSFTYDGDELDNEVVMDAVRNNNYIYKFSISQRKMAKVLNMSNKSIYNAIVSLEAGGMITCDEIYVDEDIINGGYFKLVIDSGIKGELLVFYSYLKAKSDYFGGSIDTYKFKLAKEFNTTKIAVTNLLNRLYKIGLAKRLEDGRLRIL